MEAFPGKEGLTGPLYGGLSLTILRRLLAYAEKVFQFSGTVVAGVVDRRPQPRIPTSVVLKSVAALFWARMGSLNALELTAHSRFFRRWLGQSVCSADSVGRVSALMDADGLRQGIELNRFAVFRKTESRQRSGWRLPWGVKAVPSCKATALLGHCAIISSALSGAGKL